jgi:hypothetical protein
MRATIELLDIRSDGCLLRGPVAHLAERVGFEPTNTREDVTGIPVQRLRPLGHLSDQQLVTDFLFSMT